MRKKIIILVIILIILILLVPIPHKLKDGGTVEYKSLIYKVTKYHRLIEDSTYGYIDGIKIKVLGFEIYNSVKESGDLNIRDGEKETERIVKIGNKLYYENKDAKYSSTCGTPDGYITSHVDMDKIPTNNAEANFEEAYAFQFAGSNSIALLLDTGWVVFQAK